MKGMRFPWRILLHQTNFENMVFGPLRFTERFQYLKVWHLERLLRTEFDKWWKNDFKVLYKAVDAVIRGPGN
ncbi:hypothetical protein L1987_28100 [Smallanthus sonchifolius]|uniref:Uncharacterized protein n=1 Tax=Smallanthus sonchifolius TaxID=185202 RepID=A0ACB9IBE2_9ASTR|nr:hypothetical protein L1987_28100 [Smallanthus sonchifolius]